MHIAILGTGMVGRALARGVTSAGHEAVIGTRDPDATVARAEPDRMGNPPFAVWHADHPGVALAPFADVADGADLVVNATSGAASLAALEAVGAGLEGKVLLDVANPLEFGQAGPGLSTPSTDSLAEQIQRRFPAARVVKALNTMNADVMVEPTMLGSGHLVPIAGDDDAKAVVRRLLLDLGWGDEQIHDLGDLSAARGMEMWLMLWLRFRQSLGTSHFNLALVRGDDA